MPYNISLMNAVYQNVPAVDLPINGGGTARFYEAPCVCGQFTAQSSEGVQTINIPYNGNGYPVMVGIYVSGGVYNPDNTINPTWYNLIRRYAMSEWYCGKNNSNDAPIYGTTTPIKNRVGVVSRYKSASNSSTSYSVSYSQDTSALTANDPTSNYGYATVKIPSNKQLKIKVGGSSYSFEPGIKYDYFIVYSS